MNQSTSQDVRYGRGRQRMGPRAKVSGAPKPVLRDKSSTGGQDLLNCYEIANASNVEWDISLYKGKPIDKEASHIERGKLKNLFWNLRGVNRQLCPGIPLIADVDSETIAVPASWGIPDQEFQGYKIYRDQTMVVSLSNPKHTRIVSAILRESVKNHLRSNKARLANAWQDYADYCEAPKMTHQTDSPIFCRKHRVKPEHLANNRWVVQFSVSTTAIDSRTFGQYYQNGEVSLLSEMIERKRDGRLTRQNRPVGVRVLRQKGIAGASKSIEYKAYDLVDFEKVVADGMTSPSEQQERANQRISCSLFPKPAEDVPLDEIRLIIGTETTQKEHRETIIDPPSRVRYLRELRDVFDDFDAFGATIELSKDIVATSRFDQVNILPPATCTRGKRQPTDIIGQPKNLSPEALRQRTRQRQHAVRNNGYLMSSPIDPILACPRNKFDEKRAEKLRFDLNEIADRQNLNFEFRS